MFDSIKNMLFGSSKESSKDIASKRLKFVLIHDRANVSPEVMENLKNDIIKVISKYMDIDRNAMNVTLENENDSVALVANIPINNMRHGGRQR